MHASDFRPFRIERFMDRFEFEVPHLLCASDAESMSVGDLLALEPGAAKRFGDLWLGYTETRGSRELRGEIAGLYTSVSADGIVVCSAGEEGIHVSMHSLLSAGDHVIVHQPCYQSLHEVARSIGCEVSAWRARADAGWAPDIDELRGLIRERTRLLVVNFPNNPTGYTPDEAYFREIVDVARAQGLVLFSDEMYRMLEYSPGQQLPAACDLYEKAISLGGMSKALGLPGLRLGWIASRNEELLRRFVEVKDYTTICSSAPGEFLTTIALRHRRKILDRNIARVRENRSLLLRFLEDHAETFQCVPPVAGPVAFPRVAVDSVEDFCTAVLESSGVLLLPGSTFDEPRHVRIGFGRASFSEGLDRLRACLEAGVPARSG